MKKKGQSLKETFSLAHKNFQEKNFQEAEILCKKILSIDPHDFDSISMRMRALYIQCIRTRVAACTVLFGNFAIRFSKNMRSNWVPSHTVSISEGIHPQKIVGFPWVPMGPRGPCCAVLGCCGMKHPVSLQIILELQDGGPCPGPWPPCSGK